ncbi:MAG: SAM-dependent methyltransferase [Bacteroidia bacterium]
MIADFFLQRNLIPDSLIRSGIRKLLHQRLQDEAANYALADYEKKLIDSCRNAPIAIETKAANEQHYEVPTRFYQACLGPNLKYSSGFWKPETKDLATAENDMLALTCERAQLRDGLEILELGCGWGSLSLWMAKNYPNSKITAVSNSRTQKIFIDTEAQKRGLTNLTIITADMNTFDTDQQFDRVVSVEMFEHMRNHGILLEKISRWLRDGGKLFVHIFVHEKWTYFFEAKDDTDWMSKYFFTGGMMPSFDYFKHWTEHLHLVQDWKVNGKHYAETAEAWLNNMDAQKAEIIPLFEQTYGKAETTKWWVYWRVFYMACAELWKFRAGEEWFVGHYLFEKN